MKQFLSFLTAVAMSVMCAVQANGQQTAPQWTLDQCLAYALEHNITLQQNRLTVAQDEEDVKARRAALLPTLSFSTNHNASWRPWSKQYVNLSGGTMTSTSSEVNYNGSYGLNAQWTVWNGGRLQKNLEKSRLTTDLAELTVQETANSIQEQIAELYIQILYQREAVEVARQMLEASKLQRDRAATMVEVGSLARVDLKQLEAQVSQDEYTLVSNESAVENYVLRLKQLLQLPMQSDFDVAPASADDSRVLTPVPSATDVYAEAYGLRPEIQRGKLSLQSSEVDLSIARRGFLPTVSMSAGIGTSNNSGTNVDIMEQWKTNTNNSVGMTISVPIFDGRQNRTNVRKAKLSQQAAALSLEDAEQQLYRQIETYCLNARTAQGQYVAARANVDGMQESYDLVSEQFRLGLKNIVELTTGKNNLLQAEQQMLQAKYTVLYNLAMLRFYQGEVIRL